jgi:hypothetical protein
MAPRVVGSLAQKSLKWPHEFWTKVGINRYVPLIFFKAGPVAGGGSRRFKFSPQSDMCEHTQSNNRSVLILNYPRPDTTGGAFDIGFDTHPIRLITLNPTIAYTLKGVASHPAKF